MKVCAAILSLAVNLGATFAATAADDYPVRPITMIVPFAVGGSTDLAARIIGHGLSQELGQSIVIDNRAGAAGITGAMATASATPNGYTLMYSGSAVLAGNVALHRDLAYSPTKSFELISQTVNSPGVLAVNPRVPARTLAEFVNYVKANPDKLNYGSAGIGTSQHIAGALFANLAGGSMVHVPYKGGAPAVNDLVAGRIDLIIGPVSELLPHIRAGSLVALGVTSLKETRLLPGVPPIADALPGFAVPVWQSIVAPAKTDELIVQKIHAALVKTLASQSVRDRLAQLGLEPLTSSPAEFKALLPKEIDRWRALTELSGAKPE